MLSTGDQIDIYVAVSVMWILYELAISRKATAIPQPSLSVSYLLNLLVTISIISSIILGWLLAQTPDLRVSRSGYYPILVLVVLCGMWIRWHAIQSLGKGFSGDAMKVYSEEVVTSGFYSKVRHPAYSGSLISLFGVLLLSSSIIATFCGVTSYTLAQYIKIIYEEKELIDEFGSEYIQYKNRVSYALIPYLL